MKPSGIPANYVQTSGGVWCHPSRLKAFGEAYCEKFPETKADVVLASKRIRQSSKPLLNKLEAEWFSIVSAQFPNFPRPRAQAVKFRLCNGVSYCPDIFVTDWPTASGPNRPTAWEVKGKRMWDDAVVKIKMAAQEWPEIVWIMVWKDAFGVWQSQGILP